MNGSDRMASQPSRDIEKEYPLPEFIERLRWLANAMVLPPGAGPPRSDSLDGAQFAPAPSSCVRWAREAVM